MRKTIAAAVTAMTLCGCGMGPEYTTAPVCIPPETAIVQTAPAAYSNPILLPIADPCCAWEQIVDVVDDYFRVEHEEPVRVVGNTMTEGSITTMPEVSPTIFEPWRQDTGDYQERVENTLQTMRRRAVVRVVPAQGGHSVDVAVFKELEDLARPEHASAGAATLRYDDTLQRISDPIAGEPAAEGWIAKGRDAALEQRIIGDLLSRCGQPPGGRVIVRGQNAPSP